MIIISIIVVVDIDVDCIYVIGDDIIGINIIVDRVGIVYIVKIDGIDVIIIIIIIRIKIILM